LAHFAGGRYELIAQLGGGGMADVFLAKITGKGDFSKLAVVKRLKSVEDEDPEFVKMFADEARLCARLNHPNIVQTFEVSEDTEGPFLVMEYLEGQPLGRVRSRARRREKPIPAPVGLYILGETLAALHYAHGLADHDGTPLNVVHRDVSPENILVTYAGQTKLVDFGVAKTAASTTRTRAGMLKGKVAYMAPEQARSDESIDRRADVFAAGLIMWELLTGKRMWEGSSEADVFTRLLDPNPLPRAREVVGTIPEDLDAICARALSKQKEARFDTAGEMLEAIEEACVKNNMRASIREVGQLVMSLFEPEREKLKTIVSGSWQRYRDESSGSLPSLGSSGQQTGQLHSDPSLWRATPSEPIAIPGNQPAPSFGSTPALATPSTPADTAGATSNTKEIAVPMSSPPGADRRRILGAAVVIAVLAGGGIFAATKLSAQPPAPATVATQQQQPSAAPLPTEVSIDISVKPTDAKISVDGKAVSGNPYRMKVAKASEAHVIHAEAEGYDPQSMEVAFDRDRAVDLVLAAKAKKQTPAAPTMTTLAAHAPPPARGANATPAAHTATTAPAAPSNTTTATSTPRGITEIDPSKNKPTNQDKIDTDVFKK
jgi:eukaryotic-like serine/threonine-protein kinase